MDDLAGQARVTLAQGDAARAGQFARDAIAWIESHGETGIEYPTQVYLICYRALRAAAGSDPAALAQASEVLRRGQAYLEAQAAGIQDPALRRSYLENIPFNRDLAHVIGWRRVMILRQGAWLVSLTTYASAVTSCAQP